MTKDPKIKILEDKLWEKEAIIEKLRKDNIRLRLALGGVKEILDNIYNE